LVKGWWGGARDAKERAFNEQGMKKQAAVFRAQKDEEGADQLLQHRRGKYADLFELVEDATKAKQLLLNAAESWHIAGNTAEEQRVRAKEKNLTAAPAKDIFDRLKPSDFPDQPQKPR
jgi:hypothetical protein